MIPKRNDFELTSYQQNVVNLSLDKKIFLEGAAGTGKTTTGVARLLKLIRNGIPPSSIVILTPQRTLALPYNKALLDNIQFSGSLVNIMTIGGLARRMIELFWPLIAENAGFSHRNKPPHFLTLETAQYYMARTVRPLLEEGYFDSVVLARNRLYSQIIDNLNKAALVGFPFDQIGERLKLTSTNKVSQSHIYENAQDCANRFRKYCLEHNLLDFSLQIEVFYKHLWRSNLFREYLFNNHHHLIVDNIEEDTPITHDILNEWLPVFDSALLIFDTDAGYRKFLGADPQTALSLRDQCTETIHFDSSFITSKSLFHLGYQLARVLNKSTDEENAIQDTTTATETPLIIPEHRPRFYHQMLDWVVIQIKELIRGGAKPQEIVVLAPFLHDSLRFSLVNLLEKEKIPYRTHRPSRALREETATNCLLTITKLSHPEWNLRPEKADVILAFTQAIEGLDLIRAQILVENAFRIREGIPTLTSFEHIKPEIQDRITYSVGNRYELLRNWLEDYKNSSPCELDFFLSRLFGEVLSQAGFGFHTNFEFAAIAANLIESVQKFRWAIEENEIENDIPLGKEYVLMVEDGVIAAQYMRSWQQPPEQSILLAPAYTFLLANQPVDYQFWLDIGSSAWAERLSQPLTHPYVLSRHWPKERAWTADDEYAANNDTIYRLILGLIRRCRKNIYIGFSDLSEQGTESRGLLLKTLQRVIQQRAKNNVKPQRD